MHDLLKLESELPMILKHKLIFLFCSTTKCPKCSAQGNHPFPKLRKIHVKLVDDLEVKAKSRVASSGEAGNNWIPSGKKHICASMNETSCKVMCLGFEKRQGFKH
jgi:hypothetical protein